MLTPLLSEADEDHPTEGDHRPDTDPGRDPLCDSTRATPTDTRGAAATMMLAVPAGTSTSPPVQQQLV